MAKTIKLDTLLLGPVDQSTAVVLNGNAQGVLTIKTTAKYLNWDASTDRLSLTVANTTPIDEVSVGVTNAEYGVSISYSPVFSSALQYAAASALVVQMSPSADGATGGNRANAIYARVTHPTTSKAVQGCSCAGEFEQVHAASVIVQASYGVIRLVDRNDGVTCSANRSFIMVRDYSTAAYRNPNLVNFWNFPALTANDNILLSLAGSVAGNLPYNATVRCVYSSGNTPLYLMATTTPPNALQDLKMMGSAAGNYVEWDASSDKLSIEVLSRTITGEEHCAQIDYTGTLSSGDAAVGLNIYVAPTGTGGIWATAIYGKVTLAGTGGAIPGTGYISGIELETQLGASVTPCDIWMVNLNNSNDASMSPQSAFICTHQYGSAKMLKFLNFYDNNLADAHDSGSMIVESNGIPAVNDTNYKMVRCRCGGTDFWLIGTTTAPKA